MAAIVVLAGLALAPGPAQAQICGEFEEIADDLLDVYFDELGDFFTLSENTCDAMTKEFAKACDTAVKDAQKCAERQLDSVPKVAKPACKEAAQNPSDCDKEFKDDAKDAKQLVGAGADFAFGECEDAADEFFETCRFGFGP